MVSVMLGLVPALADTMPVKLKPNVSSSSRVVSSVTIMVNTCGVLSSKVWMVSGIVGTSVSAT